MSLPINKILVGDSGEIMKTFPSDSVDCIVTDPPFGLEFMGKTWDKAVPSVEIWKECLRILKDGAFAFIMCIPRLDCLSQMAINLKLAGFEIGFTPLFHAFASGFPKAMNVSKAIDKRLGIEREVVGKYPAMTGQKYKWGKKGIYGNGENPQEMMLTKPSSEEAKVLDGSYGGFQPKPAVEVIIVCMKPLSEKTFVDQALKNGHGVSWLDDARMPFEQNPIGVYGTSNKTCTPTFNTSVDQHDFRSSPHEKGRFPANLLVSDDVLNDGNISISKGGERKNKTPNMGRNGIYGERGIIGGFGIEDTGSFSRYFDLDKWFEKTVENLPESVRKTFPFLICPKASKSERNQGCENLEAKMKDPENRNIEDNGGLQDRIHGKVLKKNFHPTVKPLKLMNYLVTLGSRKDDVVVDPFVGSGTTCLAAEMLGRKWVGIEVNMEYAEISVARMNNLLRESGKPLIEAEVVAPEAGKTVIEAEYSNAPKGNCGHSGKCGYRDENGNCGYKKYCRERIGK